MNTLQAQEIILNKSKKMDQQNSDLLIVFSYLMYNF